MWKLNTSKINVPYMRFNLVKQRANDIFMKFSKKKILWKSFLKVLSIESSDKTFQVFVIFDWTFPICLLFENFWLEFLQRRKEMLQWSTYSWLIMIGSIGPLLRWVKCDVNCKYIWGPKVGFYQARVLSHVPKQEVSLVGLKLSCRATKNICLHTFCELRIKLQK
jgi:hypothetical protein